MITGIDVSYYQNSINWATIAKNIDFAIIRAGYGQGNKDTAAQDHALGCIRYGVPFGLYWFSYAYTVEMAKDEANYLLNMMESGPLSAAEFPIFWDFEQATRDYAEKQGVTISQELAFEMYRAWAAVMEDAGYWVGLYTCQSDFQAFFPAEMGERFSLWIARYSNKEPVISHWAIWQYTDEGELPGYSAHVDLNKCKHDYVSLMNAVNLNNYASPWRAAAAVIRGEYDNYPNRQKNLEAEGYNYQQVQTIVNTILGK